MPEHHETSGPDSTRLLERRRLQAQAIFERSVQGAASDLGIPPDKLEIVMVSGGAIPHIQIIWADTPVKPPTRSIFDTNRLAILNYKWPLRDNHTVVHITELTNWTLGSPRQLSNVGAILFSRLLMEYPQIEVVQGYFADKIAKTYQRLRFGGQSGEPLSHEQVLTRMLSLSVAGELGFMLDKSGEEVSVGSNDRDPLFPFVLRRASVQP